MLAATKIVITLLKLRIGVAIAASALAGLAATSGEAATAGEIAALALAVLGASGAAGAFNHYYERESDRKMARTAGRPFASGVSDRAGSVPRFGETLIEIPVSVSAIAVVRQALGVIEGVDGGKAEVPYALRGRLAGGLLGGMRFSDSGTLKLPDPLKTPR